MCLTFVITKIITEKLKDFNVIDLYKIIFSEFIKNANKKNFLERGIMSMK